MEVISSMGNEQISDGWTWKSLFEVSERIMVGIASAATHAYRRQGVPLLRNQNIKPGVLDDGDLLFVAPEYEASFKNKRLRIGDLITMRTGYPGVTAIVPETYDSAQSFTTLITRPKKDEVNPAYLCFYINSEFGKRFFSQSEIGGAQKNVNVAMLRNMPIPLPPLPEQRAIATALSDMDALLDGLDRLITKKRAIKQATMQQLLTGQSRLPGFSGEWEVKQLGDIAWIEMGQSPDSRHYNRSGNGLPLIQGNADIEARRTVARVWTTQVTKEGVAGDLLLTVRAPVGAVGKISEDCCLGRGVCSIRPKVDADFLFHTLVHLESAWKNLEQGSTFTSANSKQVASFTLLVPVDSQEQISIATILSDMDTEITALETRRTKTRAIKQAMMQELLTGRTRLV